MLQAMLQQSSDLFETLPDTALSAYFRNAGDVLADESAVLGVVVRSILASGGHLNNKAIILHLIQAIETTDDVVKSDIIRKTLEIVVDHTMDDI
ncbi:putative two-component system connector protein AriR [Pseudescherichia vulneris NBRC 102420]|uniref:Putative two-component system connector protein AriR n=2 Tax=Pseudescherichia vulneris TaxID=566 RepID=A0A090UZT1_PSEVU|nr:biofilm development regulator YmgB/AriR family protein [Pseudescherichia vulneris]GAL58135.1 putative two-component system connector protein AriR [Pseudescherichia vulneris NBRC 102420]HBC81302.1 two-component-system connector protein AriR [Escherichia sp.]